MAVVDYIFDKNGVAHEIDCLFEELDLKFRLITSDGDIDIDPPIDWPEVPIVHKRSKDYHGFNYEFMGDDIKLKFGRNNGLEAIREEYAVNGNDGECILQQYTEYNGDEYILYEGKLDLNDLVREEYYVSCIVKRKSIHEKINSRFDTALKFDENKDLDNNDISPPQLWGVRLLSRTLSETFRSKKNELVEVEGVTKRERPKAVLVFFDTTTPDVNTIDGYEGTMAGVTMNDAMRYYNSIFTFEADGKYVINGEFRYSVFTEIGPKNATISRKDIVDYIVVTRLVHWEGGWDGEGAPGLSYIKAQYDLHTQIHVDIPKGDQERRIDTGNIVAKAEDIEIEVKAGDKLCIFGWVVIGVEPRPLDELLSQLARATITKSTLEITGHSSVPDTGHSCILIKDAIDHAFYKMLGYKGNVKSEFYSTTAHDETLAVDGCGSKMILMGGMEIRNSLDDSSPYSLAANFTMKKLYESLDALHCIGMGYEWDTENEEEIVRIEPREYFYQDQEIFEFKDVYEYKEETSKDYIFTDIEVGFDKFSEDDVNSLDEVHAYHQYKMPITSIENKLVIKSKAICSGYIIEKTRRESFKENENKATNYDDDIFLIDVDYEEIDDEGVVTQYIPITDQPFESVTGTLSPETTYNLMHTPKRMFIAWAKWLKSCLAYKGPSSVIKNTFVKQNKVLTTTVSSDWDCNGGDDIYSQVREDEDMSMSSYTSSEGIYSPEWVYFRARVSNSDVRYIINALRGLSEDGNNYGYISFTDDDGIKRKAWLYELTYYRQESEVEVKALKKKFP